MMLRKLSVAILATSLVFLGSPFRALGAPEGASSGDPDIITDVISVDGMSPEEMKAAIVTKILPEQLAETQIGPQEIIEEPTPPETVQAAPQEEALGEGEEDSQILEEDEGEETFEGESEGPIEENSDASPPRVIDVNRSTQVPAGDVTELTEVLNAYLRALAGDVHFNAPLLVRLFAGRSVVAANAQGRDDAEKQFLSGVAALANTLKDLNVRMVVQMGTSEQLVNIRVNRQQRMLLPTLWISYRDGNNLVSLGVAVSPGWAAARERRRVLPQAFFSLQVQVIDPANPNTTPVDPGVVRNFADPTDFQNAWQELILQSTVNGIINGAGDLYNNLFGPSRRPNSPPPAPSPVPMPQPDGQSDGGGGPDDQSSGGGDPGDLAVLSEELVIGEVSEEILEWFGDSQAGNEDPGVEMETDKNGYVPVSERIVPVTPGRVSNGIGGTTDTLSLRIPNDNLRSVRSFQLTIGSDAPGLGGTIYGDITLDIISSSGESWNSATPILLNLGEQGERNFRVLTVFASPSRWGNDGAPVIELHTGQDDGGRFIGVILQNGRVCITGEERGALLSRLRREGYIR